MVVNLDKNKVVAPIASRVDGSPLDFSLARFPSKEVDVLLRSLSDVVPRPIGTTTTTTTGTPPAQGRLSDSDKVVETAKDKAQTPEAEEDERGSPDCEVELTFGEGPVRHWIVAILIEWLCFLVKLINVQ